MNKGRSLAAVVLFSLTASACTMETAEPFEEEPEVRSISEPVKAAKGTRKLAVVHLADNLATSPAVVDKVWGPIGVDDYGHGYGVNDYIQDVSKGKFEFERATNLTHGWAFTHPGTSVDEEAGVKSSDEKPVKDIKRALYKLRKAWDLRPFDTNGDKVVKKNELTVLVVAPGSGGANRTVNVSIGNGYRYKSQVAIVGENVGFDTYAHELLHTLSAVDVYGLWNKTCHSQRMTIMGCTNFSGAHRVYGLDPFHLERFGWEDRKQTNVVELSQPDLLWRTDLIPSRIFTWQGPTWEQSVIFEWRRQSDRWDADVAKQGLVAWYVRRHSDGENLRLVPSLLDPGAKERGHFTLAPTSNCVLDPMHSSSRGKAKALKPDHAYRIRWLDGSLSPVFSIRSLSDGAKLRITVHASGKATSC